ncbi:GIY-YIG nuclease family protein [Solimonas terrae]|uniref:GIY-YIG nuclease family protein n=1 Tax=Solimonas terrae TaxID=1396819 RepID=A0A6M2BLS1_9GAMM|nr:GIY-YIG nuclease family protein [Solimonas terrae]NGY03364.1 GIY-YIG nuclease family protein [Solimonas terrae]
MKLNDLLNQQGIDPSHVLVLRHRPSEPALNKVLPWLAAERPEVFNAYQQTQGERLEKTMQKLQGKGYVASFIRHSAGKALFVGLYAIGASKSLSTKQYWAVPAYQEMQKFGMRGFRKERASVLWFDLAITDFYAHWQGKLVVVWPPPDRSWYRWASRNDIPVAAILEDSALVASMPSWDELDLAWDELRVLPTRWLDALSHWRGIYYIFDTHDGKGYVGSAAGSDNLLGRWMGYGSTGHGGNKLLRDRDPKTFRFTILQRVSPDMEVSDVVRLENTWKERLHSRQPYGLNEN